MRGPIALSAGLPPRVPGDGRSGIARFRRSGSARFSGSATSSSSSSSSSLGGVVFKAAYTCAGLGVVGDVIAQGLTKRNDAAAAAAAAASAAGKKKKTSAAAEAPAGHDFGRTTRQAAFNFLLYGPAQHFWYGALARWFPMTAGAWIATNLTPFAIKVFLNQAVLGPVVVTTFFAWSAAFTGKLSEYPRQMRERCFPTLRRGWVFWVPAASINFAVVPVRFQVLYMSCCSIVWNYILSTAVAGGGGKKAAVNAVAGKKR